MTEKATGFAAPQDTPLNMPICGLLGVAMLAGVSFQQSVEAFHHVRAQANPRARKLGKGWQGWSKLSEQQAALKRLGVDVGCYELGDRTLRHLALTHEPGWPIMVHVNRHIVTVLNGYCYDQGSPHGIHIDQHRDRRKTASKMWFVYRR